MGRLAVPETQFEPQIQESKFPKVFSANRLKLLATALLSLRLLCELMLSEGAVRGIGMIGAMAGPLFMFVAAESFRNTANHGRYLLRFLPASWVTGFLSLVLTSIFDEGREVLRTNNYFGTVFVLGIYILAWEKDRANAERMAKRAMDKLITRKEAASILGISVKTPDAARTDGLISYVQYVENGCVYFKEVGIQEYIAKCTHRAKPMERATTYCKPRSFRR